MQQLGAADWHITETAAVISNLRRQGKSDAEITTYLLGDGKRSESRIMGGITHTILSGAFEYLRTGRLPDGTSCECPSGYHKQECCPRTTLPASTSAGTRRPYLVAGIIAGVIALGTGAYLVSRS